MRSLRAFSLLIFILLFSGSTFSALARSSAGVTVTPKASATPRPPTAIPLGFIADDVGGGGRLTYVRDGVLYESAANGTQEKLIAAKISGKIAFGVYSPTMDRLLVFTKIQPGSAENGWFVDTVTGAAEQIVGVQRGLYGVWSPDGKALTVSVVPEDQASKLASGENGINTDLLNYYVADRRLEAITTNERASELPQSWSPDGKLFAYTSGSLSEVAAGMVIASVDGASKLIYVPEVIAMAWGPDGRMAACVNQVGSLSYQIAIYQDFKTRPIVVRNLGLESCTGFVRWSPDGKYIAFLGFDANFKKEGIRAVNIANGEVVSLRKGNVVTFDWTAAR